MGFGVSTQVAALAEVVLKAMLLAKLKVSAAVLTLLLLVAAVGGVILGSHARRFDDAVED